jgi:DNA (cytosine-5)-methyltransferase 1
MGMPKTFIDLFAGIGGFHWALKGLGYDCLLAVEKDEAAQEIYGRNFKEKIRKGKSTLNKLIGDIRSLTRSNPEDEDTEIMPHKIAARFKDEFKIEVGDVGVICGGFPCQPFSKSGAQKGDKDATRGTLFHDILLLTEALKPEYLILENVRNFAGDNHKHTLEIIVSRIETLGYDIEKKPITLSPHQLPENKGSPQVRDRVFILARKKELKSGAAPIEVAKHIDFIKKEDKPNWDASSILGARASDKYKLSKAEKSWLRIWEEFLKLTHDIELPGHPIWSDVFGNPPVITDEMPEWERNFLKGNHKLYLKLTKDPKRRKAIGGWLAKLHKERKNSEGEFVRIIPTSRRKFEWQANRAFKDGEKRTLKRLLIQFRPSGIRVKPATHYPALVAMTQTTIVGPLAGSKKPRPDYRYITPKEAAKLQGMYHIKFGRQADTLSYKQLGNAVNVKVIKYLAERLTGAVPCETP